MFKKISESCCACTEKHHFKKTLFAGKSVYVFGDCM